MKPGRKAKRAAFYQQRVAQYLPQPICSNCGKPGAHYMPPTWGWPGQFLCGHFNKEAGK